MGARLGESGWSPDVLALMKAMKGATFRAIGNEIYARHGVSISETSIRIKMRALGLAPPAGRTCVKRRVIQPPDEDMVPQPTLATRRRNTCKFPVDGEYICGKQRTFDSMDYCSRHYAKDAT